MTSYAQCLGAGLRCCMDCRRWVDNNTPASRGDYQAYVSPSRGTRCAHWLTMPIKPRTEPGPGT